MEPEVIEPDYEGPFHPLPTWLGVVLSVVLAAMILGTLVYFYRSECRPAQVAPAPDTQPTRWAPSGKEEKSSWAPRAAGQEVAEVPPSEELPDMKAEASFKARAKVTADSDTPKAAPVASWISGGELAKSQQMDDCSTAMAEAGNGALLTRDGSRVAAEDGGSRALERAGSLRTGARATNALADQAPQPPEEAEALALARQEAKAEEREARHERVKTIVRSIREDMKADRAAELPQDERLRRLEQWQELYESQQGDKVASAVTAFLEEATNWYLKGAPEG
ncbi:unnamed protein product [Symbiodinium natans]|uniref:Uncharacterized protein n=1 Tax=Symbiodinium natans TaxID=878477 RepID=A0A812R7S1_9DINO|nr:unnamed protein product [Symbiodinium natans]